MGYQERTYSYEWYTVDIVYSNGRHTTEFKAKDRDSVIRQINTFVRLSNSDKMQSLNVFLRPQRVIAVDWNTLKLDRVGHQR